MQKNKAATVASFFFTARRSLKDVILNLYFWANNCNRAVIADVTNVASTTNVVDWCRLLRCVCTEEVAREEN